MHNIKLLSLVLFAGALHAQPIPISSVPFTIQAPGTYVLRCNLTSLVAYPPAIMISTQIAGPVVLDMKGFTLTGPGQGSFGIGVGIAFTGSNQYPIHIRSGTLANFNYPIWVQADATVSGITLNHLNINVFTPSPSGDEGGTGVIFSNVQNSLIANCRFSGGEYGIEDYASPGGNRYYFDTFIGVNPLYVTTSSGQQVIGDCRFALPTQ